MRINDIFKIDFILFGTVIFLSVLGILFIYSSGVMNFDGIISTEYIRQIIWALCGVIAMLALALFDYRKIYSISHYLYAASLLLLIYTCLAGKYVNGARAWLGIGNLGIQPSEFAKLTTIIFLAQYLDSSKAQHKDFQRFIISSLIVFIPMGIILLQPDLGTSLTFIPILLIVTFIAGIKARYIIFVALTIGLSGVLLLLPLWQSYISHTNYIFITMLTRKIFIAAALSLLVLLTIIAVIGYRKYRKNYFYFSAFIFLILSISLSLSFALGKVFKEYQLMRLVVFLDPNVDSRGTGWHIIQSTLAIGSGGVYGRGFLQGVRSHNRYLPYQSTDFIFSILAEEIGFVGGMILIALFLVVLLRLINIVKTAVNSFGVYIVAGVASLYFFHALLNIGMTIGVMPITGVPLLFMSYGGSALFSAMMGVGLCLSVYIRRFEK